MDPWKIPPRQFMDSFVEYLEKTSEDSWQTETVRSKDGKKNCVMGHLFDFGGGNDGGSAVWDYFEAVWATEYMIFPVNDGRSPEWMNFKYEQRTPKQRVISYLKNLRDGKEDSTPVLMRKSELRAKQRMAIH